MCLPITICAYIWETQCLTLCLSLPHRMPVRVNDSISLIADWTTVSFALLSPSSSFFHHFYLSNWLLRVWWFFHANFSYSHVAPQWNVKSAHLSMRKAEWRGGREWKKERNEKKNRLIFFRWPFQQNSLPLSLFSFSLFPSHDKWCKFQFNSPLYC